MGSLWHKNCGCSQNFSIVEAPKPIKNELIFDHYSKVMTDNDNKTGLRKYTKKDKFALDGTIFNSRIISRRKDKILRNHLRN